MVKVADRPEFAEIPASVRETIAQDVRAKAFEILHGEAVARKDISAAPTTQFDKMPGRVSRFILFLGVGGTVGMISCLITVYMMRLLVTIV